MSSFGFVVGDMIEDDNFWFPCYKVIKITKISNVYITFKIGCIIQSNSGLREKLIYYKEDLKKRVQEDNNGVYVNFTEFKKKNQRFNLMNKIN